MILFDHVLSADCYKLRLMFALLGAGYEKRPVDMHPGRAHQTPAFRALSPLGRLPVLQDGAVTLWEPQALLYIAERCDASASWTARSVEEGAEIQTWLQVAGGPLRAVAAARARNLFGDASSEDCLLDVITIIDDRIIEQELRGSIWLAADRPTIADVALFPDIALHEDAGSRSTPIAVSADGWVPSEPCPGSLRCPVSRRREKSAGNIGTQKIGVVNRQRVPTPIDELTR